MAACAGAALQSNKNSIGATGEDSNRPKSRRSVSNNCKGKQSNGAARATLTIAILYGQTLYARRVYAGFYAPHRWLRGIVNGRIGAKRCNAAQLRCQYEEETSRGSTARRALDHAPGAETGKWVKPVCVSLAAARGEP